MTTSADFATEASTRSLGENLPQKMGRRLWLPMFVMALMAFPVALVLSWVRAAEIASASPDGETIATLGQLVPAFQFIGFAAVFAAVSFAIARILGRFRAGGGEVQEAAGSEVKTLKMPATARIFLLSMMMGMMGILAAVALHFVVAANVTVWPAASIETWSEALEGVRRLGVGLYLFGITFGLGAIIHVLRFQSIRIREVAGVS
ncbi:MAG: hypothetical protein ABIJ48_13090 [Actinomycetota bacterium]